MTDVAPSHWNSSPREHPFAVPALFLALVASAVTLIVEFGVIVKGWPSVSFAAPSLFGIASLVIASVASREISLHPAEFTGRGLVVAAKVVAWVGAVIWSVCVIGVALGPMASQHVPVQSP